MRSNRYLNILYVTRKKSRLSKNECEDSLIINNYPIQKDPANLQ